MGLDRSKGRMLFVCCATAVLLCAYPARAQQARELLQQAATRFSEAEFGEALKLLKRARAVVTDDTTRARIHLYLGLNHSVLGQAEQARADFRLALALDPALTLRPEEIKRAIVELVDEVRGGMRGELAVTANRPDGDVYIDGKKVGSVPFRNRVVIGSHRVEVRTPDRCLGYWQQVVVFPDRKHTVDAQLRPVADTERCAPSAAVPSLALPPAGPETSFWRRRRIWTWVAAGTAGLALAAAIGVGASAQSDFGEYETTTDPERGQDLTRTIESKDLAANLLFGVGGVLAATAVVLLFVEGHPAEKGAPTVGLGPSPGRHSGLLLSGRF